MAQLTSDLSDYHFPHHIIPTTQRPDVVWWDDSKKKLCLIELTVCFETSFNDARERKMVRYEELHQQAQKEGYCTTLITLEVGSRGTIHNWGFSALQNELHLPNKASATMLKDICQTTIAESHRIWCQQNHRPS